MANKALFSLLSLLPAYFVSSALARQYPLAGTQASQQTFFNEVNFTELFAPSYDPKSGPVSPWNQKSFTFNGITTFAGAKPVSCFGGDDTPYDVAVLGTSH